MGLGPFLSGEAAEAAAREVRLKTIEECARRAESFAEMYPREVFPDDSKTPDGKAGRMARHTATSIAAWIRAMAAEGEDE